MFQFLILEKPLHKNFKARFEKMSLDKKHVIISGISDYIFIKSKTGCLMRITESNSG